MNLQESIRNDLNKINEENVSANDMLQKTSDILSTLVFPLEEEIGYMKAHGWDKAPAGSIGHERWVLSNRLYSTLNVGPGNALAYTDDNADEFTNFINNNSGNDTRRVSNMETTVS